MKTTVTDAGLALHDTGAVDNRPPLVLLHGLTFDHSTWAPVTDALRLIDAERRVLAVDLPGHGDSLTRDDCGLPAVADTLRVALEEAGVSSPVLIGHSISGGLAGLYASRYPATGIVNVDQPLDIAPFARLVRTLEPKLTGREFSQVWQMFWDSFHTELLPPGARRIVEQTCRPQQQTVLAYWRLLLQLPPEDVAALIEDSMIQVAERNVPYLMICGHEPSGANTDLLQRLVPQAQIEVWPNSGHFPHLAHPERFARLINEFALER
jgi:pimeloyl-ACP methyl ester carboxylesterase